MNEEEKDKFKKALQAGRVEATPRVEEALANFDWENPDSTLKAVSVTFWGPWRRPMKHNPDEITGNGGGIGINYMMKSAGCGRADFYIDDKTGKLRCYNQAMGKKFLATLFDHILENTELDS